MLEKLRGRTARELLVRMRQASTLMAERNGPMGHGVDLDTCGLALSRGVTLGDMGNPARSTALAAWDDPRSIARTSRARWPAVAAAVVARADAALEGRFTLLGYTTLDFGQPIDWHLDPIRNRRSPREHWSRIPYLDPAVVGDHKVIWELNRHQHLVTLAQACLLTEDDRYATGAAAQLQAWMDQNPAKVGINWASSLEISYRSIAWCWVLHLLRGHPGLAARLVDSARACLALNARHIESYLSTYFAPNTHLTGEALGLLYVGCAFPELPDAARWRETGWHILVEELDRQVLADGVYYEQSTYYQRYVLDIFVHAMLLAERAGLSVPPRMRNGVVRLAAVLEAVMDPDGGMPLIGDDDGGRLLPLSCAPGTDVRPALAAAQYAVMGPDRARPATSNEAAFETLWLTGVEPAVETDGLQAGSQVFPDGGMVVLRHGTGRDTNLMVLDGGRHGSTRTNAVHSHADALAFDLVVFGRRMLADPGTFTYVVDPAERDRFRSTRMHNAVTIGQESSSVMRGPFGWSIARHARLDSWAHGADFDYACATLHGYGHLGALVTHRREVLFLHVLGWFLRDRVAGHPPELPVQLQFHGAAGVEIRAAGTGAATLATGDAMLQLLSTPCEAMTVHDDLVSPLYGLALPSRSLTLTVQSGSDVDVMTAMIAGRPGREAARITRLGGTEAGMQVQRDDESWQVRFAEAVSGSAGPATWTCERPGTVVRRGSVTGLVTARTPGPMLSGAR
jgi:hypothetical protein